MKKHLALSSEYTHWSNKSLNILLGKWCLKDSNQEFLDKNNYIISKNVWNHKQTKSDYLECDKIKNKFLKILSLDLNSMHEVNFSLRLWNIIIGWWLQYHIQIIYDRYKLIMSALSENPSSCNIITLPPSDYISCSSLDYFQFVTSPIGNFYLLGDVLRNFNCSNIKYNLIDLTEKEYDDFKYHMVRKSSNILGFSCNNKTFKYTFSAAGFSPVNLRLELNEKGHEELPQYESKNNILINKRKKLLNTYKTSNLFEFICVVLLRKYVPKSFVEDFRHIIRYTNDTFPSNKGIIYTSNSIFGNDTFKIWTSNQIHKNNSLLVLGQHGNNYGNLEVQSSEGYERDISDYFITWGWSEDHKTIPLPSLILKKYFENHITPKKESKSIIFVDSSFPLHRYWFYSSPQSSNHLDTIQDTLQFYNKIKSSLINNFDHRLYLVKYGWNESNLLKKNFPNLNITNSKGNISLESQLNNSRMCIVNYHSTVLLQCIAADYPIVCYWNFDQWKLREGVKPLYEELQNAGILHSSPQSAANFINQYYYDIDSWWNDSETINSRKSYAHNFCRFVEEPEKEWALFFKKVYKLR